MAVSGAQAPNLAAVNRILAQIGKSIEADSTEGVQVSGPEADKILDEVGKLPPGAQKLVQAELIQLLVNDTFQTTPEARLRFAEQFGVQAKDLEPRDRAELVGLSQTTSAFQIGVEAVAQKPKLDRKEMKLLIGNAESHLDVPNQQFLAGVLRNASRDGTIKMDSDARKLFRKWMGGLDQKSGVSDWTDNFDTAGAGNIDYLSGLMASGMCFEDLVAAFMMHMAGKMQKEMMEKMREIERSDSADRKQTTLEDSATKNREGALADAGIKLGGDDDATTTPATPATPDVGNSGGAQQPSGPDLITRTKRHLEALVSSVDAHGKADSDGGASITRAEAEKIAEKLDRVEPPVDKLIATSLHYTLRRTEGIYLSNDNMGPMVNWLKSKLGDDILLTPLKRRDAGDMKSGLARGLSNDNKLENKIAGFIVDTLLVSGDDKGLKEKMADVRELSSTMRQHAASDSAFQQVIQPNAQSAKAYDAAPRPDLTDGPSAQPRGAEPNLDPSLVAAERERMLNASTPPPAAPLEATGDLAAAVMGDPATAETGDAQPMDQRMRQMEMEKFKQLQQEFSSVMQAMSNMLNSMHQTAMNSIRAIR